MLYAIVGLLLLLADQITKYLTVKSIELNAFPGKEILGGLFHITHIENAGAAFGLGSSFPALRWILLALLIAFALFVVLGIVFGYLRTGFARWTGVLLLTGLLGNGIDRAIYGYVVDMIEPTIGSMRLPIFNLADCLVVIFGIMFCISLITGGIGAPEEEEEEDRPRRVRRDEEDERPRRRREADAPQRARSAASGQKRPSGSGQKHPSGSGQKHPSGKNHPSGTRKPRSADGERPRRPRPERENAEAVVEKVTKAAPAARRTVESVDGDTVVTTVARPIPAAPAKTETPAASVQKAPAVKIGAAEARERAAAEQARAAAAEKIAETKTAAEAKPAAPAKSADDFDLDSILAEFK